METVTWPIAVAFVGTVATVALTIVRILNHPHAGKDNRKVAMTEIVKDVEREISDIKKDLAVFSAKYPEKIDEIKRESAEIKSEMKILSARIEKFNNTIIRWLQKRSVDEIENV